METIYDWISVGLFAGLVVLFMQRSTTEGQKADDPLWMYLAAGVGCGAADYLGNNGMHVFAIVVMALTVAFIFNFLKPFSSRKPR